MKLYELFEAVQESSLHQLRGIAGNLAAFLERDLKHLMHDSYSRLADDDVPKLFQKLKFVLNSRKARWFNEHYFTSKATGTQGIRPSLTDLARDPKFRTIHDDLRTLIHLPIHGHTPTRIATEQTASKHFATLVSLLPNILNTVARYVPNGESFDVLGDRIRDADGMLVREIERLQEKHFEKEPKEKAPKQPKDELRGQQMSSVEAVVNQTIKELVPKKHQGEVRNRIAKAGNKILALQAELDRLGIKP